MLRKLFFSFLLCSLAFPVISYAVPGFMLARMGTLSGQVFVEGKPAKGPLLAFFMVEKGLPPISSGGGMGRIPDMLERADDEGKFSLQLLQGSYYMGVLFRPFDDRPGPPRKGEKFYFANDGQDKLRRLAITDFQKVDVGRIDCSLPTIFKEEEDHFAVEGVVLRGEGIERPVADAMVLAKRTAEAMRPEYISGVTDHDGKFSIKLPPDQTFYLVARASITGARPNPGEDIGKLGVDKDTSKSSEVNFVGAPTPPSEDFLSKAGSRGQLNDTAIPVTGKKGEVISGMKIHMFKMPDGQAIREARQNAAGGVNQLVDGSASTMTLEFAAGSDALALSSMAELDALAKYLQEKIAAKIEISATPESADAVKLPKGTKKGDYFAKITISRQKAVQGYLEKKGVLATRIQLISSATLGEKSSTQPATPPQAKGRVEIKVLESK